MVDQAVDGDVPQDAHTERDEDATVLVPMAHYRHASGAGSVVQESLPPGAASRRVVVGDIPLEPPGFQSRADLLAELDRAGTQVAVIHGTAGLRGLGTTQLAAAYARAKLADGWRLVAWVNAAETGSLQAGLAAVAEAAGLTDGGSGRDIADAGQALRCLLETDGDYCLLVFDDVADPEALRPFIPAYGKARVLITSTRPLAAIPATGVPVNVFSADAALSFLTERTGRDDEAGAAALAAVLGHLPLALALAAPLIRGQRYGYAWYLDRLQTIPAEVSLTAADGQPYPNDVVRAVLLALAAIRAADKTGMCTRVIEIMAVLSAGGARRELLHLAGRAGVLATGGHRVEAALVDRALEWLGGRSLLTFSLDGQTIMMHRLVAQVVRDGLVRRRGRLEAVCWAAASVLEARAIAVAGSPDRSAVRGIPQQVAALVDHTAELAEEPDEELAGILLRLRFIALYHLIELGDSAQQAIAVGEPLTADLELMLGPGHPDTLNSRNSLAAAFLAAGRIADAIRLFEQTQVLLQRQLGTDHPDTLTSQNNLASAYQDAGWLAEAIQLYEQNLAARERLLDPDHPSTLNSRGNLAAAYLAAGRVAEAIALFEQTLAARDRVLGPDHPDTETSRKNLATAYRKGGRVAKAIPLEQTLVSRQQVLRPDHPDTQISRKNLATAYRDTGRVVKAIPLGGRTLAALESEVADNATAKVLPASLRRPPADSARRVLPGSFLRPPADPAGRLFSDRAAGPSAELFDHSPSQTQDPPLIDAEHDRQMVVAITAGNPAGIAMAYDRYAAALYGYCRWMLHDSADAAESLQDTFVLTAATLSDLPEPAKLRARLFALARSECRRRIRPGSVTRDEDDAASHRADGDRQADEVGRPVDATVQLRPVRERARESSDETIQFRPVRERARESSDETMQFRVVSGLTDATMLFRVIGEPADVPEVRADVNGHLGQAELRRLIRSVLADVKPREREVIELSFRHDLSDDDLAVVLGVSRSRALALASRAGDRLEKSLAALRAVLAGREGCSVVGELLADWDGQLTEQTRDLVAWHVEQCQTCASLGQGGLRPTALSGLLPLAPLPLELRKQVMSCCFSTDGDAVAYRQRVVRRSQSTWLTISSQALRRVSWQSIRANPGPAIATTAVAVWVAAALVVTLLTFAGSHTAHAQAPRPSAGTSSSRPAAASASATGIASTKARLSLAARKLPTHGPSSVEPSSSSSSSP